eukprot:3396633-Pleurochrysis_carterae.AAC.2
MGTVHTEIFSLSALFTLSASESSSAFLASWLKSALNATKELSERFEHLLALHAILLTHNAKEDHYPSQRRPTAQKGTQQAYMLVQVHHKHVSEDTCMLAALGKGGENTEHERWISKKRAPAKIPHEPTACTYPQPEPAACPRRGPRRFAAHMRACAQVGSGPASVTFGRRAAGAQSPGAVG